MKRCALVIPSPLDLAPSSSGARRNDGPGVTARTLFGPAPCSGVRPAETSLRTDGPTDLDALLDRFDRLSFGLVRLEAYSLEEIRRAVDDLAEAVEVHAARAGPSALARHGSPLSEDRPRSPLGLEHDRFRTSVEQLRWFLAIVEREDHGGHRQALGQYGRVLVEALRRHRSDERRSERRTSDSRARTGLPPASPKRKERDTRARDGVDGRAGG